MTAHGHVRPPDARIIKALYAVGLGRLVGRIILLLTTTGRKSGLPRVTPLQYEAIDGAWYVASARGIKADWFQNILANRYVQVRVKARHMHGIAEPITDPRRIADFRSLRLRRHPKMIGAILRSEGLPAQPSRADLEAYAQHLAMVIIRPAEVEDTSAATAEDDYGSRGLTNRWNRFIYRLWAPIYDRAFTRLFAAGRHQAAAVLAAQPGELLLLSRIGTGADLLLLPRDARVVGIELSPAMLARARARQAPGNVNVLLIQADAQALPLCDGVCDAALLNLIVSVAPDGGACLREAALRPSGSIVIFDKFLPDDTRVGCIRHVLNAGAGWFGTAINHRLGDILADSRCVVEHNLPSLARGVYRVVVVKPNQLSCADTQIMARCHERVQMLWEVRKEACPRRSIGRR